MFCIIVTDNIKESFDLSFCVRIKRSLVQKGMKCEVLDAASLTLCKKNYGLTVFDTARGQGVNGVTSLVNMGRSIKSRLMEKALINAKIYNCQLGRWDNASLMERMVTLFPETGTVTTLLKSRYELGQADYRGDYGSRIVTSIEDVGGICDRVYETVHSQEEAHKLEKEEYLVLEDHTFRHEVFIMVTCAGNECMEASLMERNYNSNNMFKYSVRNTFDVELGGCGQKAKDVHKKLGGLITRVLFKLNPDGRVEVADVICDSDYHNIPDDYVEAIAEMIYSAEVEGT